MAKTATAPTKTTSKSTPANTIRPLHDKILVRRDEAETKTESGIYLPEKAKDRPKTGTVEGRRHRHHQHRDRRAHPPHRQDRRPHHLTSYSGTEVKLGDTELLVMSEDEVLAVID